MAKHLGGRIIRRLKDTDSPEIKLLNLEIFSNPVWQMSLGERSALEGVLSELKPSLSIEIGTAEGGSLERIAKHSEAVHSFDLVTPQLANGLAENVTLHTGDSHELLPIELERLAEADRNVDFVMVDGDHSSLGVRHDIEDLLNSPAVAQTFILIHDTTNRTVRAGLDAIHYGAWPKVARVDLDFVSGYMFREDRLRHELWGGLGLIVVDSSRLAYTAEAPVVQDRCYPAAHLLASIQEVVIRSESEPTPAEPTPGATSDDQRPDRALEEKMVRHIGELEEEILRLTSVSSHHESLWRGMMASVSWRVTEPLRAAAAVARRGRRV